MARTRVTVTVTVKTLTLKFGMGQGNVWWIWWGYGHYWPCNKIFGRWHPFLEFIRHLVIRVCLKLFHGARNDFFIGQVHTLDPGKTDFLQLGPRARGQIRKCWVWRLLWVNPGTTPWVGLSHLLQTTTRTSDSDILMDANRKIVHVLFLNQEI